MVDVAQAGERPFGGRSKTFAPWHPWDRNFFLAICLAMLAGVGLGFGSDIVRHVTTHARPYPPIVHLHAAVFSAWLILLIVQVSLVRVGRRDLHRKLGTGMLFLAALMLAVGPATAYISHRERMGQAGHNPSMLIVQLTDMIAFATMVAAGVWKRADPSAHKRLMLLATIYISDAGFFRILRIFHIQIGPTLLDRWSAFYFGPVMLILCMGVYDFITRRHLHPAYVAGASLLLFIQVASVVIFLDPRFRPIALTLLGYGGP